MRGLILAGGSGTRLWPLTAHVSKQLLPVYDKPMVYYPLATLKENGVEDVCVISTPRDLTLFEELLGNGKRYKMRIEYRTQEKPKGIAEALLIASDFIGLSPVALILGDNLFHGSQQIRRAFSEFGGYATIFGYRVANPSDYGVVTLDNMGRPVSLIEKPKQPEGNLAVPGLYLYDSDVVKREETLRPSARGELEITDLNIGYMKRGELMVYEMEPGSAWLDCGTPDTLLDAANYVRTIQQRQGVLVGSPL